MRHRRGRVPERVVADYVKRLHMPKRRVLGHVLKGRAGLSRNLPRSDRTANGVIGDNALAAKDPWFDSLDQLQVRLVYPDMYPIDRRDGIERCGAV